MADKRITLHPTKDDGTLDTDTNLYPKTTPVQVLFSDGQRDTLGSGITAPKVEKLDGIEAGAQVNKIESSKVNGTAQTVSNKAVNISVPTKTSDLSNDSNFVTTTWVSNNYQTKDADLTAIAALSGTNGFLKKTATNTWTLDTNSYALSSDLSNYQPLDSDLTAISGITGAGLLKRNSQGTWTLVSQADLISGCQPKDDDLTAIAGLTGEGLLKRNSNNTWTLDTTSYATTTDLTNYLPLTGGTLESSDGSGYGTVKLQPGSSSLNPEIVISLPTSYSYTTMNSTGFITAAGRTPTTGWRFHNSGFTHRVQGNEDYTLSFPSLTADTTIATTSDLSGYLPITGGTLSGNTGINFNGKGTIRSRSGGAIEFYSGTSNYRYFFPASDSAYVMGGDTSRWLYVNARKLKNSTTATTKYLLIPETTSWTSDRTIATIDDIREQEYVSSITFENDGEIYGGADWQQGDLLIAVNTLNIGSKTNGCAHITYGSNNEDAVIIGNDNTQGIKITDDDLFFQGERVVVDSDIKTINNASLLGGGNLTVGNMTLYKHEIYHSGSSIYLVIISTNSEASNPEDCQGIFEAYTRAGVINAFVYNTSSKARPSILDVDISQGAIDFYYMSSNGSIAILDFDDRGTIIWNTTTI